MKLRLSLSIFLFASTAALASATAPGKFYVGAFGGGGSSNHFNSSQYGTIFFIEANGGPLSVNAFGQLDNRTAFFLGAQLGYQAQEVYLNSSSQWALRPAAELEGYTMNKRSFEGTLINNTDRVPEHVFMVSYPMKRTLFLANAVLNFNNACFPVHPYIGFGMGSAIVRISSASANATQTNPPEVGLNHYNANTSDTNSTFAGQIKLGLNYDVSKRVSFFAEYRWLYLAKTHFVLGSTVYPTHPATSSWEVNLNSQRHNLGNVGIRFNW